MRDYGNIDLYASALVGQTVKCVAINPQGDEGLVVIFENGAELRFAFSGYEGAIEIFKGGK